MPRLNLIPFALAALVAATTTSPVRATIYGTMSNFDVFNDTPTEAYGAELELEDVHSADVISTYPSHFDHRNVTEYVNGATFGTRVTFTGYNFNPDGFLAPTVGQSTNGHTCVNTPGCEHFGFSVSAQPTATRYYWLDQTGQRIGNLPMEVPTAGWSYVPANGGGAPLLQAQVEIEKENEFQHPDALWMKVFKTEINRPVKLKELMSGNAVVPEDAAETETEWELLEDGVISDAKDKVGNGKEAVIRRYEFFKYTGPYSDEHEADTTWGGEGDPPANELGDFVAANMVAANLVPQVILPGDYNGDDVVDAADYTVWRDHLGSEVESDFDADRSGLVDGGDYDVWNVNFGSHGGPGAGAGSNAVPEPTTTILVFVSLPAILFGLRFRRAAS